MIFGCPEFPDYWFATPHFPVVFWSSKNDAQVYESKKSKYRCQNAVGLFKQRSTKEYLTRKLKSRSEVCEGYVILDSYAIWCEARQLGLGAGLS